MGRKLRSRTHTSTLRFNGKRYMGLNWEGKIWELTIQGASTEILLTVVLWYCGTAVVSEGMGIEEMRK